MFMGFSSDLSGLWVTHIGSESLDALQELSQFASYHTSQPFNPELRNGEEITLPPNDKVFSHCAFKPYFCGRTQGLYEISLSRPGTCRDLLFPS